MPETVNTLPLNTEILPIDHLALCGARDAVALVTRQDTLTHADLDHRVGRVAALLRASGLQPGDRVATWLGKTVLACVMPLAAARAGLIHVPVNPLLKRAQVAYILSDSGTRLLITNAGRLASLEDGDLPEGCATMADSTLSDEAASDGDTLPSSTRDPQELAAILYTSGSTGRPKGVMLSHANMWLGAESVAHYLRLQNDDRVLGVLPLSFDYGQNQLLSTWFAGASVAPLDYLAPNDVVKAVERFGATTLAGVPPLWVQLLDCVWPAETAARLRRLTNSGGALTPRLVQGLRALFPAADIYAMYGLTEAFRSTYLDPALIDSHPESIGTAIPHAEILIVRPDGSACDAGEAGELVHCGPLVAQGYWQDATRTAERFKPAPAHSRYGGMAVWSGDNAVRDHEGLLHFVGRDDAMIKTSGTRVSPTEVEEGAEATGLVAESVAFGVKDAAAGQVIALIVRPRAGVAMDTLAEDLAKRLRADLPNFMQPRHILVRAELPRNPNGKLDRVAIVAEAMAEIEAAQAETGA